MNLVEYPLLDDHEYFWEHPEIYEQDKLRLYNYYNIALTKGEVSVNYAKKRYNNKLYGRYFPQGDIYATAYQWNKIRATLFTREQDIDIVNAHPVLLSQLYKNLYPNNVSPILDDYIMNRDKYFNEIEINELAITYYNKVNQDNKEKRDIIKTLFTLTIYGGGLSTWKETFMLNDKDFNLKGKYEPFKKELKIIVADIIKHNSMQTMVTDIRAEWNKKQIVNKRDGFKLLSIILQTIECKIVRSAMNYFKHSKYQVTSYIYDGFQILNKQYIKTPKGSITIEDDYETILQTISTTTYKGPKKCGEGNYKVTFIAKPFKEPLDMNKLTNVPKWKLNICRFLTNPTIENLANVIKLNFDDNCIINKKVFYKFNGKIWTTRQDAETLLNNDKDTATKILDRDKLNVELQKIVDLRIFSEKQKNKLLTIFGNGGITKAVNIVAKSLVDDKILFDDKPNLLNCNNGTLDLDTMQLKSFNKTDYLTKIIDIDYNETLANIESFNKVKPILEQWFLQPDNEYCITEILECILFLISTCLHGNNPMQKAIVLIGTLSRNGKGTFMRLLRATLGDYIGTLNKEYFTAVNKQSGTPEPEILEIKACRIIDVSEADGSDHEASITGTKFKAWIGKDMIKVRDLHAGARSYFIFRPQGTMIFSCNANLQFARECNALSNRLVYINFPNYFGDESFDGWSEHYDYCKRMDPLIDEKLNSKELQISLFHTLLYLRKKYGNAYVDSMMPQYMKEYQKRFIKDICPMSSWIKECLVNDTSAFSYENEYDKFWIQRFPAIEGKQRCLTHDYIMKVFSRETEIDITKRAFTDRLRQIFTDRPIEKRTKLFGKYEYYIPDIRFINQPEIEVRDK